MSSCFGSRRDLGGSPRPSSPARGGPSLGGCDGEGGAAMGFGEALPAPPAPRPGPRGNARVWNNEFHSDCAGDGAEAEISGKHMRGLRTEVGRLPGWARRRRGPCEGVPFGGINNSLGGDQLTAQAGEEAGRRGRLWAERPPFSTRGEPGVIVFRTGKKLECFPKEHIFAACMHGSSACMRTSLSVCVSVCTCAYVGRRGSTHAVKCVRAPCP